MAWVQAIGLLSALAGAVDPPDLAAGKLVTVHGEAEERVPPDFVAVKLTLESQKASADENFAAEGEAMASLQTALRDAGVAAKDMLTVGPTINKIFKPGGAPVNAVRGVLNVGVRALDRLSDVVRAAQAHGAEVESLRYDTTGRKARQDALRAAAMDDAHRKAEILAEAAGMKVGEVHAMVEEGANLMGALVRGPYQNIPPVNDGAADAGAVILREGVYVSFDLAPK